MHKNIKPGIINSKTTTPSERRPVDEKAVKGYPLYVPRVRKKNNNPKKVHHNKPQTVPVKRVRELIDFRRTVVRSRIPLYRKRKVTNKLYAIHSLFTATNDNGAKTQLYNEASQRIRNTFRLRTLTKRMITREKSSRLRMRKLYERPDDIRYHKTAKHFGRRLKRLLFKKPKLTLVNKYKFKRYRNGAAERRYYLRKLRSSRRSRRRDGVKPKKVVLPGFVYKRYIRFIERKRKLQKILTHNYTRFGGRLNKSIIKKILGPYQGIKHALFRAYRKTFLRYKSIRNEIRLAAQRRIPPRPKRGQTVYFGKPKARARDKRFILKIRQSKNNVFATITDIKSKPYMAFSAGRTAMSGPRRSTPFAAELLGRLIGSKLHTFFNKRAGYIVLKTHITKHIRSFLRTVGGRFKRFIAILDFIPRPHGHGLRGRKVRRL
jgi:ribosomal protein S11